jgi:hypothetical protein
MDEELSRIIDRLVDRIDELILLRAGLTDRRPIEDGEVLRLNLAEALRDFAHALDLLIR